MFRIEYCSIKKVAGGNGIGTGSNQLRYPWGIYLDSNSSLYIVDRNNHRLQKWDNGKFCETGIYTCNEF